MIAEELYRKLAKLAVRRGVNVQKDQPLVIRASVRDYEFVRMCAEEAYAAGAKSVTVDWSDEKLTRLDYEYQSMETLTDIPDWQYDRMKGRVESGYCRLSILSDKPGSLAGVDAAKIRAASAASSRKFRDFRNYSMNNIGQWSVVGVPSVEWAKVVFPELPEEEAFEKLGEALFMTSRVTVDTDPLDNWEKHDAAMVAHAKQMTAYNFKELHFTSASGTDLYLQIVKAHEWVGGGSATPSGVWFDPNIPTEEVFCMPEREGVNGIVYASKPLNHNGQLIKDFWFRFENGKVVEHGAKEGIEVLNEMLDVDEGSRHLGEVALVPYDSPISQSGILFYNTLYDENAACHLALGMCYAENLKGGTEMDEEELKAHGGNTSLQHIDFMFGTADMSIDGIQYDGTVIPVFRNGNFVF